MRLACVRSQSVNIQRNPVIIAQYCAEGILRKHLAEYGVVPELATELVSFEQKEDGVTAHLVKHDGDKDVEDTVVVDYLVGADGAHSKRLSLCTFQVIEFFTH